MEIYTKGGQWEERLSVSERGLSIAAGSVRVDIKSEDEFNNACEVLIGQGYHYFINNSKKDVVIDIGMNIGAASLYFLNSERTEKVYAYEPFKETYLAARNNLQKYIKNTERIAIFQYGISNENNKRMIGFNRNMTCGQSTLADTREEVYGKYRAIGLVREEEEEKEMVEVRDAAEVLLPIIKRHSDCNIIMKLDCEGEEYGIIEELYQKEILGLISFIMMEWHYRGKDTILGQLKKAGFSYWCSDKPDGMGLIYAYKAGDVKSNVYK